MLTLFSFSLAKSSILIVSCKSFVIVTDTSSSEESVKIKLILALSECYLYLLRAQKFDFQNESFLSVYPVKTWLDSSSGNGAFRLPFLFSLHSRWTLLPREPPHSWLARQGVVWSGLALSPSPCTPRRASSLLSIGFHQVIFLSQQEP